MDAPIHLLTPKIENEILSSFLIDCGVATNTHLPLQVKKSSSDLEFSASGGVNVVNKHPCT